MPEWLKSASVELLIPSTLLFLSAGLIAAALLRRRPAAAQRAIVLCGLLSIFTPAAFWTVREAGVGLLAAPRPPAIVRNTPSIDPPPAAAPTGIADARPITRDDAVAGVPASSGATTPRAITNNHNVETRESAGFVADRAALTSAKPAFDFGGAQAALLGMITPRGMRNAILFIWAALSTALLARLCIAFARGRTLIARSAPASDVAQRGCLQRAARRLGVKADAEARTSPDIASPVIWCWSSRPIILLPAPKSDAPAANDDVDWQSVFSHELAHWVRRDHWAALLGELLASAFWWNPLAWMAKRRIAYLSDRACDQVVLTSGGSAARYAESLMALSCDERHSLALGVVSGRSSLFLRIRALLAEGLQDLKPDRGWSWTAALPIACGIALAFCQPGATPPAAAAPRAPEMPQQAAAGQDKPEKKQTTQSWDERLAALADADWRESFALGGELATLPPDEGMEILTKAWPHMPVEARQQTMKAFRFVGLNDLSAMHNRLIDVLHLGMTDTQPQVQEWSINYLREIALEDFSQDINAYHKWYAANHGRPPRDVMLESCRRYITELRSGDSAAIGKLNGNDVANHIGRYAELQKAMTDAGGLDLIESWLKKPSLDEKSRDLLSGLMYSVQPDEAYLRRVVLPAARNHPEYRIRSAALRSLGKKGNEWAVDPLLELLVEQYKKYGTAGQDVDYFGIGMALGSLGDPRAIPTIVGVIQDDNSYETVYGLGYFALSKLTGVRYEDSHNGAWWTQWWDKNKSRFAPDVEKMSIPQVKTSAAKREPEKKEAAGDSGKSADAEPAAPVKDCRVKDDENKRYFLIGDVEPKNAPRDGYHLLIVLPGGDGGPDFNPFVSNIQAKALPKGYLIAQLVAPKWSDDKDRIVWPTQKLPDAKMKFPTERFIDDVIRDVTRQTRIDRKHVYALGWSSGGPPVYYAALQPDAPVRGAVVAMSVFHPEQLPPLENAKDKAFYVLHSPTDFIKMDFPNAAISGLKAAGAHTHLQTYEGGHGWHGDVFGMIRAAVEWLENPTDD